MELILSAKIALSSLSILVSAIIITRYTPDLSTKKSEMIKSEILGFFMFVVGILTIVCGLYAIFAYIWGF